MTETIMVDKMHAQDGLLWRRWGNEFVIYNPASGDSHYLDYLSGEGLKCLERKPMTLSELVEELSGSLEVPADDALRRYVEKMLASFAELGLTKPPLI